MTALTVEQRVFDVMNTNRLPANKIPSQVAIPKTDEQIKKEWKDFFDDNMPGKGLMKEWLARVYEKKPEPISTGYPGLDEFLGGGLRPGLYLIGGNPGAGKTTLIQNLVLHISGERPTIFFSLEMSRFSIMSRLVSACSFMDEQGRVKAYKDGIHCSQLNDGILGLGPDIENKLQYARTKFEGLAKCLIILDHESVSNFAGLPDPCITMNSIQQITTAFKNHFGIAPIVAVDYLQIIPDDTGGNPREAMINICRRLSAMRNELDLTLLVLFQYSRAGMQGKPELSSGAESSEIEKTAEMVLALHDPSKEKKKNPVGRPSKEDEKKREDEKSQVLKPSPDEAVSVELHKLKARDCPNMDPVLQLRHWPMKALFTE